MGRRRFRGGNGRAAGSGSGWNTQLFVGEGLDIDTADTVSNTTVTDNAGSLVPAELVFSRGKFSMASGATATAVFCILRRLPFGYASPNIAIATGLTTFVDETNIMAYGYAQFVSGIVAPSSFSMVPINRKLVFHEGDTLLFQMVSATTSASLVGNVELAFKSRDAS